MYISNPDFYCGTDGTDQPKVVQEVLADLLLWIDYDRTCVVPITRASFADSIKFQHFSTLDDDGRGQ